MSQSKPTVNPPLWLLAELTYRCPLQCPYCSNPLDFARQDKELTTEQWIEVFRQARAMGRSSSWSMAGATSAAIIAMLNERFPEAGGVDDDVIEFLQIACQHEVDHLP